MDAPKRQEYIPILAREYAESGSCDGFLRVVLRLRQDGFSNALQVLDNIQMREELNNVCRIAQSETESRNRMFYRDWLENVVDVLRRVIVDLEIYPNLSTGLLMLFDSGFHVTIKKKFNSDQLQVLVAIEVNRERTIGFEPPIDMEVFLSEIDSDEKSFEAIVRAVRIGRSYRDAVGRDFFTGRVK